MRKEEMKLTSSDRGKQWSWLMLSVVFFHFLHPFSELILLK